MLQDIIGLVRNRGHRILIEGVETDEQMALMREFGIDLAQGFHIGQPVPAAIFRASLAQHTRPTPALKSVG